MKHLSPEELALLTPEEIQVYAHQLEYELAKLSPLDLACWLSPETQRSPHLEYINERIVALVELRLYPSGPGPAPIWFYEDKLTGKTHKAKSFGEIPAQVTKLWGEHPQTKEKIVTKLGIAVPPRHGKSWIVTDHLPIWFWLRFPDAKIAFATYSDKFAEHWGRRIKRRLLEHAEKLGLSLRNGERQSVSELSFNETNGEMYLVGTGGSLTGKGWNLGIIDDPIKDAAEALSKTERENNADWYTSTFTYRSTRIGFPSLPVQIMMFTRWHEDDLAGRFIYETRTKIRDDWHMIRLPALAEADDPLGREPGEALWPTVMTRDDLIQRREENPLWFSAMYQGFPTMGDKGMFPRWFFYEKKNGLYVWEDDYGVHKIDPADTIRFATLDTAYTKNTWSDYTVFAVWEFDRDTQRLFLVHVDREKIESPDLRRWLEVKYSASGAKFVGIEDSTSGKQLLQELQRKTGIVFRKLKADRDKVARAWPYGMAASNGMILLPKNFPLIDEWLHEHAVFDGQSAAHDDMVDAGAYAHVVVQDYPAIVRQSKYEIDTSAEARVRRHMEKIDKQMKRNRSGRLSGMLGR